MLADQPELSQAKPMWKIKLKIVMDHWTVTALSTSLILYALFSDDLKLAFFPKEADPVFNVLTCLALVLFSIEIMLNALCQDNYFNSFYFWLDVVSTITLVADITWVWNAMIGYTEDYESTDPEEAAHLARTAPERQFGTTRASRFTRVIRLVRLVRIGRLWKQANSWINRRSKAKQGNNNKLSNLMRRHRTI